MQKYFRKRRSYGVLLLMLLAFFLLIYSRFLWGGELYTFFDANDDTYQSYLPVYQMVVSKLRAGDFSLLTLNWGAGTNILCAQFVLLDPFALILYAAGVLFGPGAVAYALIWAQLARILCAGAACLYFLRCFALSDKARLAAALAYAFSAYMVGGMGQHYMFATAPVLFALMLGLLERSLRRRRFLPLFALAVAVTGLWSLYFCYMMLLTSGLYALFRFLGAAQKHGVREIMQWFVPLLAAVCTGLLLAGVTLLPTALLILNTSSRVSTHTSLAVLLTPNSAAELKTIFLRLFSEQMQGSMNAWTGCRTSFNVPHLYCTALLPACLPQFAAGLKRVSRRARIVLWAVLALVLFSFLFPFVGNAYNVFVDYSSRYAFVLLPFSAYAVARVLSDAGREDSFSIAGAVLTLAACAAAALLRQHTDVMAISVDQLANAAAPAAVLAGLYAAAHRGSLRPRLGRLCRYGAVLCVLAALVLESRAGLYADRRAVDSDWYDECYHNLTGQRIAALQAQDPSDFFRTERSLTGWGPQSTFSNSMAQYYAGVSVYNSLLNRSFMRYRSCFGDGTGGTTNISASYGMGSVGRPLDQAVADLWGVRYLFTNYPTQENGWTVMDSYTDEMQSSRWLLRNDDLRCTGLVYTCWYDEQELDALTAVQRQALLSSAVSLNKPAGGVQQTAAADLVRGSLQQTDTLTLADGSAQWQVTAADTIAHGPELVPDASLLQKDGRRVWLTFEASADADCLLTAAVDSGFDYSTVYWANRTFSITADDGWQEYSVSLPSDTRAVRFMLSGDGTAQVRQARLCYTDQTNYTNAGVHMQSPSHSGGVSGTVTLTAPGIFVMPICYEDGWSVTVDGQPAQMLLADRGLCAVALAAGTHTVAFNYDTPGIRAGAALTLLGAAAWCVLRRYSKKEEIAGE